MMALWKNAKSAAQTCLRLLCPALALLALPVLLVLLVLLVPPALLALPVPRRPLANKLLD